MKWKRPVYPFLVLSLVVSTTFSHKRGNGNTVWEKRSIYHNTVWGIGGFVIFQLLL